MLVKTLFDRKTALISSFFFALSAWHIAVSRELATVLGVLLFFSVLILYLFYYSLKRNSMPLFYLTAFFLAIGLCIYDSILALFPLLFLFFLIYKIIYPLVKKQPRTAALNLGQGIIFILVFVIVAGSFVCLGFRKDFKVEGAYYPAWIFRQENQFTKHSLKMFGPNFWPLFKQSVKREIEIFRTIFPPLIIYTALGGALLVVIHLAWKKSWANFYIFLAITTSFFMFTTFRGASGGLDSRYLFVVLPLPYILSALLIRDGERTIIKLAAFCKQKKLEKINRVAIPIILAGAIIINQIHFLYYNYFDGWIKPRGGNTLFTADTWHSPFFRAIGYFIRGDAIDENYKEGEAVVLYDPGKNYPLEFQIPWYTQRLVKANWGLYAVMINDDNYLIQRMMDLINSSEEELKIIYYIDGLYDYTKYNYYKDENRFSFHHPNLKKYQEFYTDAKDYPIVEIWKFTLPPSSDLAELFDDFDSKDDTPYQTTLALQEDNSYEMQIPNWYINDPSTIGLQGSMVIRENRVESTATNFNTFKTRVRIKNPNSHGGGQSFGFGDRLWQNDALFFVYQGKLFSRTYNDGEYTDQKIPGINLSEYHLYQIKLLADQVEFYIDGKLKTVHNGSQHIMPGEDQLPLIFNSDPVNEEQYLSSIEIDWVKTY